MSGTIKVAQLVLSLELGGLERLVVNFLSAVNREEFDITVGCLEGPGPLAAELEPLEIPVTTFDRHAGLDWGLIPKIARWLRHEQADLLHTHNAAAHFYGALGARVARTGGTLHTKHGRDWPDQPRKVLLNRISALFTNKLIAVSRNGYDVAREIEKVPARKLMVIHNGIDTRRFTPDKTGDGTDPIPGIPAGAPVIGTVARLSPEKDQHTLLEAFAKMCESGSGCYLVIAGDGPERKALAAHAESLPCGDKVVFLGAVENVPSLLKRITVFVLTSLTEGISLALLEAAASGIPSVVTDAGGNAEVIEDGISGFVVPPGQPAPIAEKLAQLISDESLRGSMGLNARKRVEQHFSLANMTAHYETLYRGYYKK
jgi:glycosyltransferase involved in cell wall biosynthesis